MKKLHTTCLFLCDKCPNKSVYGQTIDLIRAVYDTLIHYCHVFLGNPPLISRSTHIYSMARHLESLAYWRFN